MPQPPDTSLVARSPADRGRRLDSWKEIAAFLGRHETTVRRWEREEQLPVHRHRHLKLGSVYAFTSELDCWRAGRGASSPADPLNPGASLEQGTSALTHLQIAVQATPFIGRTRELELLASAWDERGRGPAGVILVSGEAGIGKTRLIAEHAGRVASRGLVLTGRADGLSPTPFGLFAQALRPLLSSDRGVRADVLTADLADSLAPLSPLQASLGSGPDEPAAVAADSRRYRMFEAVGELLQAVSLRAPVLLVLEDVHAADRGSLLLMRHLVRSGRQGRVSLVVSFTETALGEGSMARLVLSELRREAHALAITLRGMTEAEIADFAAFRAGRTVGSHVLRLLSDATHGNPLFLSELVQHLVETERLWQLETSAAARFEDLGVPEALADFIDARLSGLGADCRRLLGVAAVAGEDVDLPLLEAVARLDEDDALDALDEAVGAKLLRESATLPGHYGFVHALTRMRIYQTLTSARRGRLHLRIAETLEGRADAPSRVAELAFHFGEACTCGGAPRAALYASRAGDLMITRLAFEDGVKLYRLALRARDFMPPEPGDAQRRVELLMRCARAAFAAGQWQAAHDDFQAALHLLDPEQERERGEILLGLAETAFWLLDVAAVRRFAAAAQEVADRVRRDDLWADAAAWRAAALAADGDVQGAIVCDREAVARAGGVCSFGLARAPLTLYWAGRSHEAVPLAVDGVERARRSNNPAFLMYALQHLALCLSASGEYDASLAAFEEARAFGRQCGALPLLARATSMSVAPLLALGDLAAAEARAHEARDLARRVDFEPPLVSAGLDLLMVDARLGRPDHSLPMLAGLEATIAGAAGWHGWKWRLRLDFARAALALARGDCLGAATLAERVVVQSRARSRPKYEALALALRARALAPTRRRDAVGLARQAVAVGRQLGDPAVLIECISVLIELDGTDEVCDEGRGLAARVEATLSEPRLRAAFAASLSSALRLMH